jgi:hypothetical protein
MYFPASGAVYEHEEIEMNNRYMLPNFKAFVLSVYFRGNKFY